MKFLKLIVLSFITFGVFIFLASQLRIFPYRSNIVYSVNQVPTSSVAMVLGGGMKEEGIMSKSQYERVLQGIYLYKSGKVKTLLMSGDDGKLRNNEVDYMKEMAVRFGVPEEDVIIDGKAYRTYLSCLHAKQDFDLDNLIIISQSFHLPRARYFCESQGIKSLGLASDFSVPESLRGYVWNTTLREVLATMKGWWEIEITKLII